MDKEENRVWDVSLEKIQNDIGYEPQVDIVEAIEELATYFKGKND